MFLQTLLARSGLKIQTRTTNIWSVSLQVRSCVSHQSGNIILKTNQEKLELSSWGWDCEGGVQVGVTQQGEHHLEGGSGYTLESYSGGALRAVKAVQLNTNSKINSLSCEVRRRDIYIIPQFNSIPLAPSVAKCLIFHGRAGLNIRCLQSWLQKL